MFLDTSYIVKAYVEEIGSKKIIEFIDGCEDLSSSSIAWTEFHSALARKRIDKEITDSNYDKAIDMFSEDIQSGIWHFRNVDNSIINKSNLIIKSLSNIKTIRTLDAIHLSTAVILGFDKIYSDDKRLIEMSAHWGIEGINILKE